MGDQLEPGYQVADRYVVEELIGVGGFADVQARVMRLIGDPERRYREDPVRMLRAVRLAAKLTGWDIDLRNESKKDEPRKPQGA